MSIGRHERVREPVFLITMGGVAAALAAVIAAVASDPRFLRLAVVLALASALPHAFAAVRAPSAGDIRALRREVADLRGQLGVRPPAVEGIVGQTPPAAVAPPEPPEPTSNGHSHAYGDRREGRHLVLDLVALEDVAGRLH